MFYHIFINKLKILLRNKTLIFWTLIFPIVLATFFNLAFSGLNKNELFNPVHIAVVNNDKFINNPSFKSTIESLSESNEGQIFITKYVTLEEAESLLNDNKIAGYILVDETIKVFTKKNGLETTIIKSVGDSYYQATSVIGNILEYSPESLNNDIILLLNQNTDYFKDYSKSGVDYTVIYFYSLIGMVCLYGGFFGVNAVNENEANLSKKGARTNLAPIHKLKVLLISLLVGFIVQYLEVILLILYVIYGLGISFGNHIIPLILLTIIGSMAGISMGTILGAGSKKNENVKIGILVSVTMALSFLSGMMSTDIKYIITKNIPFLGYINPVNLITDALYSLYYYDTLNKFIINISCLSIITIIMITGSYFLLRRKKYASV